MARRNKKRGSRTYAQPVASGNQTMSFDLSQANFSASLADGVTLTPNKIRALLGLTADTVDAIKITSIIFSPWVETYAGSTGSVNSSYNTTNTFSVDFVDGQRFTIMDKSKPTKVKPSSLSPAGRWQDSSSTSISLVNIKGPFRGHGSSGSTYSFMGSVIVNVAVRVDKPTGTALTPI